MPLKLIVDTADQQQNGLYADWRSASGLSIGEYFNADTEVELIVQPVRPSEGAIPWESDFETSDEYHVKIGNPDDRATGGTFIAQFATFAASSATVYNATAAQMKTAIDATSQDAGFGSVTVTLLQTGVYRVDWDTNGAVTAIPFDATLLEPVCEIDVRVTRAGSGSTKAQQIVSIKQSPVASVTLSTPTSEVDVSASELYPPSNTQNAVWNMSLSDHVSGQYAFLLTANGIASRVVFDVNDDVEQIGAAMNAHPSINYQKTDAEDNITITKVGKIITIGFIGTLGGVQTTKAISAVTAANPAVITSTAHGYTTGDTVIIGGTTTSAAINGTRVVTVIDANSYSVLINTTGGVTDGVGYATRYVGFSDYENNSLLFPAGVTGVLPIDTVALEKKFAETTEDSLDFTFEIKQERSGGGIRVIFSDTVTIKRSL